MTKYPSNQINRLINSNIEKFIEHFNVRLSSDSKKFSGSCPLHYNSDNENALLLYKNTGIWRCNTNHCEQIFTKYPIGFIRGLISSKKLGWQSNEDTKKIATFEETVRFVSEFFDKSQEKIIIPEKINAEAIEKQSFIKQVNLFKQNKALNNRENFRSQIIPSDYYINRGFSPEILDKYDVGILKNKSHQFYNRIVVPIYNAEYTYIIGYTARSIFEKCIVCGFHHDLERKCLEKNDARIAAKWIHSSGLRTDRCLYNYWFAKDCLNGKIILVEGPSHVWKLSQAGFLNSVATFGSNMSIHQSNILKRCNIKEIILVSDNDMAGIGVAEQIKRIMGSQYKYRQIELEKNDIAELSVEEIKNVLA